MTTEPELLRKAAALMRERAEACNADCLAPYREWRADGGEVFDPDSANQTEFLQTGPILAAHIASWHPAVAIAVARWLLDEANLGEARGQVIPSALAVARTYLGSDDDRA